MNRLRTVLYTSCILGLSLSLASCDRSEPRSTFPGPQAGTTQEQAESDDAAPRNEPPIRVKNGSLDIIVLDLAADWDDIDKKGRKWGLVNAQERANEHLRITIDLNQLTACEPHDPVTRARRLQIVYSDHTEVTIQSEGRRTVVSVESEGKRLRKEDKTLTYGTKNDSEHIETVLSFGPGRQLKCRFGSDAELGSLQLLD